MVPHGVWLMVPILDLLPHSLDCCILGFRSFRVELGFLALARPMAHSSTVVLWVATGGVGLFTPVSGTSAKGARSVFLIHTCLLDFGSIALTAGPIKGAWSVGCLVFSWKTCCFWIRSAMISGCKFPPARALLGGSVLNRSPMVLNWPCCVASFPWLSVTIARRSASSSERCISSLRIW